MSSYAVPARVAFVVSRTEPTQVFLMPLPDGPPFVLKDTAAMIWVLAADGETDVPTAVGEVVDLPRDQVAADVESYLDDLVAKGLLQQA